MAFRASDYNSDNKPHLLLAASGSVATIKIPSILQALSKHPNLSIRLILTPSATAFLQGQSQEQPPLSSLLEIPNVDGIYSDADEWAHPWVRMAPILHIELRRWADILVIAPLSANMLAKIVGGVADGLLANVVRAWDTTGLVDGVRTRDGEGKILSTEFGRRKRVVVAFAMNTAMWRHPVTAKQVRVLEEEWGWSENEEKQGWVESLRPMEKELACGDIGDGAMKDWKEIVSVIEQRLGLAVGI